MFNKRILALAATVASFIFDSPLIAANEVDDTVKYFMEHSSPSRHIDEYAMRASFEALAAGMNFCNESQANTIVSYYFDESQGVHIEANRDEDEFVGELLAQSYQANYEIIKASINPLPILTIHENRHPQLFNFSDDKITYNEYLVIAGLYRKVEAMHMCNSKNAEGIQLTKR